jgi:hypothetical protein
MTLRFSFWTAATIESALVLVAIGLAWVFALPWWACWRWDWFDFGWGVAGAAPMLTAFWWLIHVDHPAMPRIREFIERILRPALGEWSVAQLLAISALAGVAEELLFRAVLQGGMARAWGQVPALLLAGALFGACHWITPAYALIAGLMGCYLGGLWWWRDNLLTPVISHAVYDAVALIWLVHAANRRDRSSTA